MNPVSVFFAQYRLYFEIGAVIAALVAFESWNIHEQHTGAAKCSAEYAQRDNKALSAANTRIKQLEDDARAKTAAAQAAQDAKETQHLEIEHAQQIKIDNLQHAARAGIAILSDSAGTCTSHPSSPAESSSAPSVSNGASGCQLSGEVAANLYGEAGRANAIVRQLGQCQETLIADIKQCNAE